ncbi:MAG TPA: hypothetical protein VK752_31030 [Bryobacteraceae bacterium]|nr:hypothetical protein [Bryobacteraceae bacterium]
MRLFKNVGVLALLVAIFALAQRVGNYENRPWRGVLLGLQWPFVWLLVWDAVGWWRRRTRTAPGLGPLVIDDARWICVKDAAAYIDKTTFLWDRIKQGSLRVLANNDLGDPCLKFHPGLGGHSKELLVRYSRKGSVAVAPNEWLEL